MIWLIFGIMLLAAALTISWPLYRRNRRLTPGVLAGVVIVLGVTAGVYMRIGTPQPPAPLASVDEMVAALEQRLDEHPEDVDGWKMLGRSQLQLQNFSAAAVALERALALESPPTAQTLAELGEVLLLDERTEHSSRPNELFESALAAEPRNPKALFYGGIMAIERGDRALAADRWEALLALSPPREIEDILRLRIAEWRGDAAQASAAANGQDAIAVDVSLGPDAAAVVQQDATVFIFARDPEQPSPPIAAARRKVSELPVRVSLSDADAMVPGRLLSAYGNVEIVARVSASGEALAQPGDWYGEHTVAAPATTPVEIVIERQVP